ncbi:MAG: guanylate kinase [Chloroflexota bacterium]
MTRRGIPFVVSGPSGAGKGTLVQALLSEVADLTFSVSATTRPARDGEVDGVHYHFLERPDFERRIEAGDFLEWSEYCGNLYGTLRGDVESLLVAGRDVIFDIEVNGASSIKRQLPEAALVFILPPSLTELAARIRKRGSETEASLVMRLARAREEIQSLPGYDYLIMNDTIEDACSQLKAILSAERRRVSRLDANWLDGYLQKGAR